MPAPYSTVALDCAIRLKTETAVPGTLYQRTVIAEQNLISELYPYQERVFLFVDPELVSASVCSALLLEIQAAQEQQTPEACMRHVVSHALQAALGEACHTGALNRKLQVINPTAWASSILTPCTLPASGPWHPFPNKLTVHTCLLKEI